MQHESGARAEAPETPLSGLRALRVDLAQYKRESWITERAIWGNVVFRIGQSYEARLKPVRPKILLTLLRLPYQVIDALSQAFTGMEIPCATVIGPGLRIHHGGNIVINPSTVIGRNCVLRHGVTLGNLGEGAACPTIGDDVSFGAYAQVFGPVTIGDGARIGAMTVVLTDVPPGATVVGTRARIIERSAD